MKFALTVLNKELRDSLRDRRTLVSMIIMPLLLMPAIVFGIAAFSDYQMRQSQEKEIKLGVPEYGAAPDLFSFIESNDRVKVVDIEGDAAAAVRSRQVDIVAVVSPDWEAAVKEFWPANVELFYNSTRSDSSVVLGRITAALNAFGDSLIERRMQQEGIDAAILTKPAPVPTDVATAEERGGFFLGFLLPLFLVMWSITGGMYTAIDVSAGEKERKTLEPLLATPVRRFHIVVGKLMAVSVTAVTAITLAVASLYVAALAVGDNWFSGPASSEGMNISVDPSGAVVMFAAGVLLAAMFAALELACSIFAKSYREAQSYLTPLYLVAILPIVVVNMMLNLEPAPAMFLVPAVNAVLLFKEVLLGTVVPMHTALTLISLALYASVAVFISTRIYEREGVLFRSG